MPALLTDRDWARLVRLRPVGNGRRAIPKRDTPQNRKRARSILESLLHDYKLTPAEHEVAVRRLMGESIASIAMRIIFKRTCWIWMSSIITGVVACLNCFLR